MAVNRYDQVSRHLAREAEGRLWPWLLRLPAAKVGFRRYLPTQLTVPGFPERISDPPIRWSKWRWTIKGNEIHWTGMKVPDVKLSFTVDPSKSPRQIDMTHDVHTFTSGWNDLLAQWARLRGVAANMHPEADPDFDRRIKIDQLVLREAGNARTVATLDAAMHLILSQSTGRINVRGANGAGKSTLLTSLKSEVRTRAYYWPTADRLSFQFAQGADEIETDDEGEPIASRDGKKLGFSSGERQLRALREIVSRTDAPVYLLDEWDANLDPNNRAAADALVDELARRARVVEISHRDRV